MHFAGSDVGSKMNVVAQLRCWDPSHETHLFAAIPGDQSFSVCGLLDGSGDVYTFMHATLKQQYPRPVLVLEQDTKVFQHDRPSWSTMCDVIELCSGFGGMSHGMTAVGFSPVLAVDFNEKMIQLYQHHKIGEKYT